MIQINFQEIISFSALILSIIGILYTRENIKLSKYIDTITSQRIKWVDVLREELAQIITLASLSKEYSKVLISATNFAESPFYDEMESDERDELESRIDEIKQQKTKIVSQLQDVETLNLIEIVLLKLNAIDDIKLIKSLSSLKKLILNRNYLNISNELLEVIRDETKQLLKNEWERIKKETKNGRESSGKNEKKFWA